MEGTFSQAAHREHWGKEQAKQVVLDMLGPAWRENYAGDERYMPTLLHPPFISQSVLDSIRESVSSDLLESVYGQHLGALYAASGRSALSGRGSDETKRGRRDPFVEAVERYCSTVRSVLVAGIDREWGAREEAAAMREEEREAARREAEEEGERDGKGLGELRHLHGIVLAEDEWAERKKAHNERLRAHILQIQGELAGHASERRKKRDLDGWDDNGMDGDGGNDLALLAQASELAGARRAEQKYELLGEILAALYKRRSETTEALARIPSASSTVSFSQNKILELVGTSLPGTFRKHLWSSSSVLGLTSRAKTKSRTRGVGQTPSQPRRLTPKIDALMRKAVTDIYTSDLALAVPDDQGDRGEESGGGGPRRLDRETYISRTSDIVNQLFVEGHEYTSRFVVLAFPLITVFPDEDSRITLAHSVLRLNERASLREVDLVMASKATFELLETNQAGLHRHISLLFERRTLSSAITNKDVAQLFRANDVSAVVRPWLESSFVGFLPLEMLLFVWDQFFLVGFDAYPLLCVALLTALKPSLLASASPESLLSTLKSGLFSVYTVDVQQAFLQLYDQLS